MKTRHWWTTGGLTVLGAVVLMQLVPYGHNRVNPPIVSEPAWDSPATRRLVRRACFDCHSNETAWPAYSQIAPVFWLVQHDVNEGQAQRCRPGRSGSRPDDDRIGAASGPRVRRASP
jgi:Haem-binding domain